MSKKARQIQAPRGTEDILPSQVLLWNFVEQTARDVFRVYSYSEIRTPIFEDTDLFVSSIGETTDIVEKEMYSFADEEGPGVTLRPEGTAPLVRAYLQHGMHKQQGMHKLYYMGPMFRRERPQKGRRRQFHQIGVEAIGSYLPTSDAETIMLAAAIFDALGLDDYQIRINSIGCPEERCRGKYREALREQLKPQLKELCDNCQRRYDRNVFRILDCKREQCKSIALKTPTIEEHLCEDCASHFAAVKSVLEGSNVKYKVDAHLVRGFDYYTKTIYEITSGALGAQDAIGGGGRYDNLISDSGGPEVGAVGFALGVERTIIALEAAHATSERVAPGRLDVWLVAVDKDTHAKCFELATALRREGISADLDYESRSVKAQMRAAGKAGAAKVVLIGPDEIKAGEVKIKDMASGEELSVAESDLIVELQKNMPSSRELACGDKK